MKKLMRKNKADDSDNKPEDGNNGREGIKYFTVAVMLVTLVLQILLVVKLAKGV